MGGVTITAAQSPISKINYHHISATTNWFYIENYYLKIVDLKKIKIMVDTYRNWVELLNLNKT